MNHVHDRGLRQSVGPNHERKGVRGGLPVGGVHRKVDRTVVTYTTAKGRGGRDFWSGKGDWEHKPAKFVVRLKKAPREHLE